MRRVVILKRWEEFSEARTGLDRYSEGVERALTGNGIEYDKITFKITIVDGLKDLVLMGFLHPLSNCLKLRDKDTICHATDELCGIFFPWIRGKKVITVHHVVRNGEYMGRWYTILWNLVARIGINHSDVVIAVSEPTKKELVEHFKIDPDKVVCLSNPAIDDYYVMHEMIKEKMIGCVGALIPRKNMGASIMAFKHFTELSDTSDYRMRICGSGVEEERLLKLIFELGLSDRIEIISNLTNSELREFYNQASLIFNTSMREGLGHITIESQKCGTPVLHLRGAEIPESVLKESISCDSEKDMATVAHDLLISPDKYREKIESSKKYAENFGNNYDKEYLEVLFSERRQSFFKGR